MIHQLSARLLAAFAIGGGICAQTITWGPVLPSTSPLDVNVDGKLMFAGNATFGQSLTATVRGQEFVSGFRPTGWNGFVSDGLNGSSTGDAQYDRLLRTTLAMQLSPTGNPSVVTGIRLDNLASLTAGRTYEVQLWFTDQRTGTSTNPLYDRQMELGSAFGPAARTAGEITNLSSLLLGPPSGLLEADPDNAPAVTSPDTVFGSHCTGTFVYDDTDQLWLTIRGLHPDPAAQLQPHITALQIRDPLAAAHITFGAGCHEIIDRDSDLLERFPDTPSAKAALDGGVLEFVPSTDGYVATFSPGAAGGLFVQPSANATIVADSDDTTAQLTLSQAVPVPGVGGVTDWNISSNGVLTANASGNEGNDFSASLTEVASAPHVGFYNWFDYNPTETGSGKILSEEISGMHLVTFDGVFEISSTQPATFQFQIELSTGVVRIVWQSLAPSTSTATTIAGCTLVGTTPVNVSQSLNAASSFELTPPKSFDAMTLTASPDPVLNPSTVVTYTIDNVPEFLPGSGLHLSLLYLSGTPVPTGIDLTGLVTTVPGCSAFIGSLDLGVGTAVTFTPSNAVTFAFATPQLPPGAQIAAQAVALFDPAFPLANGEAGGIVVSNGILSTAQVQ